MKKIFFLTLWLACAAAASAQLRVDIDVSDLGPEVSPMLYGIFYEDINHAADGGLYAELIRNRSFEDDAQSPAYWEVVDRGNATAAMELVETGLLNSAQQRALKVTFANAEEARRPGISNAGYWGIPAVKGRTYKVSFWAKGDKKFDGTLRVGLQNQKKLTLGHADVPVKLKDRWQQVTATFTATFDDPQAQFVLTSDRPGTIYLDVVSLFPPTYNDRPNGLRPDLVQYIADLKPKFMRFPGGCFVEGSSAETAYHWNRSVGPIEARPAHPNTNWNYPTTNGLGFHELLQLAEDLGAKPLYVVNLGIWHGGCTPYNQVEPWIEECLNALEYANGPVTSTYGKMRTDNGHPEPFGIEYLELGNENNQNPGDEQSDHYAERYKQFYDAVKAKYPNMKIVGNTPAWGTDEPKWNSSQPVDLVDEHYYRSPSWFAMLQHKYDAYPRDGYKVYVGEYAVTQFYGKTGNLNAALGEAVFMMGMENNSDVVSMASYAPLLVNENEAQWQPDLIRFDATRVFATPSYYIQKMFPQNLGNRILKTDVQMTWQPLPVAEEAPREAVRVGLSTWDTEVVYRDPQVLVYGHPVPLAGLDQWEKVHGTWQVTGNEAAQTSRIQQSLLLCPTLVNAERYTFKVKAMKTAGAEGFMPVVGCKDKETYNYFNVGGWTNSKNNIEQCEPEGKHVLAGAVPYSVETGRWYDLQIDVDGDTLSCYVDGVPSVRGVLKRGTDRGVYASSTLDEQSKVLYVKVVNVGEEEIPATINLKHARIASATLETLTSASGRDENTMDNPRKVVPRQGFVQVRGEGELRLDVAPFSANVVRVQLQ